MKIELTEELALAILAAATVTNKSKECKYMATFVHGVHSGHPRKIRYDDVPSILIDAIDPMLELWDNEGTDTKSEEET